jgi:hypothetical protein
MQASIRARLAAGLDVKSPICVYALCKARDVIVRFNDVNMDGMYDRFPRPRIHLSALRHLVRRNFTCAHELGHHEFGHGSTIDELRDEANVDRWNQPNEVLADAFAAFTLMPTLGLREAFAQRGTTPDKANAIQLYSIASNFGVGLTTLTTHMTFGIEAMTRFRHAALASHTPRSIRSSFLGYASKEPLIIVDERWNAPTIDAEEGHLIWLPAGVDIDGKVLLADRAVRGGMLYRAIVPGIARAYRTDGSWACFVRVARREYVGLADYRHLEDEIDD